MLSFFTSIASLGWEVPSFTTVPAPSSSKGDGYQPGTAGGLTVAGEEAAVPMGAQIRKNKIVRPHQRQNFARGKK